MNWKFWKSKEDLLPKEYTIKYYVRGFMSNQCLVGEVTHAPTKQEIELYESIPVAVFWSDKALSNKLFAKESSIFLTHVIVEK
tara:strand:- start:1714 stop:1962 length:249 start_codon:yes stop_codon:yes gene_type:complete